MFCKTACRFLSCAAIIANVILIIAVGFIVTQAYGDDVMLALLLAVPPVLSIIALTRGPDKEQRQLETDVAKARLRRELAELEGK